MDPYQTLGVARDASESEIKKAYRALVKEAHPDSGNPGDIARFRAIQNAYEALSNPGERQHHDSQPAPMSWTGGFEEPLAPFREVRSRAPREPVHLDIVLSPDEARRGGHVVLEVPQERTCARCSGQGLGFFGWCSVCRGEGWLETREDVRFRLKPGVSHGDLVTARASDGRLLRARVRLR